MTKLRKAGLMCVIAVAATTGALVTPPAEASTTYIAVNDDHVRVVLPKAWKRILPSGGVYTQGHTSGAYHTDFTTRVAGGIPMYTAFRIDGYDGKNNYSAVVSKTTARKQTKDLSLGDGIGWSFKNKNGNVGGHLS